MSAVLHLGSGVSGPSSFFVFLIWHCQSNPSLRNCTKYNVILPTVCFVEALVLVTPIEFGCHLFGGTFVGFCSPPPPPPPPPRPARHRNPRSSIHPWPSGRRDAEAQRAPREARDRRRGHRGPEWTVRHATPRGSCPGHGSVAKFTFSGGGGGCIGQKKSLCT